MTALFSTVQAAINLSAPTDFTGLEFTFEQLVSAFVILILVIAALVFFFMLIWGGIKYITSGGDKGQTESARSQITAALIGLVIVFSAWAILALIDTLFNVDITSLNIPTIKDQGV